MATCKKCGNTVGLIQILDGKCRSCRAEEAANYQREEEEQQRTAYDAGSLDQVPAHIITEKARSVIATTSIDIPGREIEAIVSIVASEVALGLSIFKDIANNWRDFVGGRANTAQKSLKEARTACLDELKREAAILGADAVIAVDLDYNELSTSGSGGILFVAATGTAVRLKQITAI